MGPTKDSKEIVEYNELYKNFSTYMSTLLKSLASDLGPT
jgi:hypothetical protein